MSRMRIIELSATVRIVQATLPNGALAYYINLTDDRGLAVSSELTITAP